MEKFDKYGIHIFMDTKDESSNKFANQVNMDIEKDAIQKHYME